MKADWRADVSTPACVGDPLELLARPPGRAVRLAEQYFIAASAGSEAAEQRDAFFCQHDVAHFATLAAADRERSNIFVEVAGLKAHQLAKAASRLQRGFDQYAEIWQAPVNQALRLGDA